MINRAFLALLVSLALAGCAPHVILRDPSTGQTVDCTMGTRRDSGPPGPGLGGAIGSGAASGLIQVLDESRCQQSYLRAGYVCIQGCTPSSGSRQSQQPPGWTNQAIVLPTDLQVVAPPASVPSELAAWSGKWAGTLEGVIKHVLVVEEVQPTEAIVVVAFTSPNGPVWRRHRAIFDGGALKIVRPTGSATYRLQVDGTVSGTIEADTRIIRARLTREPS